MKAAKTRREKGFAIVLTTLALVSTLLIAGLGFDVGTLYLIRTKLQGAMDAAALATVRALAQNPNVTAAKTVGQEFLVANFPTGYWGAQPMAAYPVANAITVSEIDANGNAGTPGTTSTAKLVTVTAGVTAPLYFLRILGQQSANISFTAQATRQGLLVVLVLDASYSMSLAAPYSGKTPCQWAQTDAQAFLGYPQFDPDIDRIGAVAFGGSTYTVAPTANFQSPAGTVNTSNAVYTALNSFACQGYTNTVEGLQQSYNAIKTFWGAAIPSRANVVILMTDGAPNGFTADWTKATLVSGDKCAPAAAGGHLTGFVGRESGEYGVESVAPAASMSMTVTDPGAVANNGKCAMGTTGSTGSLANWFGDWTLIPPTDAYGDALYGAGTYVTSPGSAYGITSPGNAVPANSTADSSNATEWQFVDLSRNAADGIATQMRTDSTYRIGIYCIGLYGNAIDAYDAVDDTLMNRIANTTTSTAYSPGQPVGVYVTAPNSGQLAAAFAQVASAIVARLSK